MTTDAIPDTVRHLREPSGYIPAESRWENYVCVAFGTFPTYEQFEVAFSTVCADSGYLLSFGNDPYVGTCKLTCSEVWEVVADVWDTACSSDVCDEDHQRWVSNILGILGWEWV